MNELLNGQHKTNGQSRDHNIQKASADVILAVQEIFDELPFPPRVLNDAGGEFLFGAQEVFLAVGKERSKWNGSRSFTQVPDDETRNLEGVEYNSTHPQTPQSPLFLTERGLYHYLMGVRGCAKADEYKRRVTDLLVETRKQEAGETMSSDNSSSAADERRRTEEMIQQTQQMLQTMVQGITQSQQQTRQELGEVKTRQQEFEQDVDQKLQNRQLSEDLQKRSAESMRQEIVRLVREAVNHGAGSYPKLYNLIYDDVADYDSVDFRIKYKDRGSKSILQMLTTHEMGLVLESARYLYD